MHQAPRLTSFIEPPSESYSESCLRMRILDAWFPRPTAQIPVLDNHGSKLYRLDLGWPGRRLAVEYDGEEFHSSQKFEAADARRRESLAREFGWQVVGVGRAEVLGTSLRLESGLGELLGLEPGIRRRTW